MSNLNELEQREGYEIIELTPPAELDVEQQDLLHEQGVVGPARDNDEGERNRARAEVLARAEALKALADLRGTLSMVRRSATASKQAAFVEAQQKIHTALLEFEAATGHQVRYIAIHRDPKGTWPWPYKETPEAKDNPYQGMIHRVELTLEALPEAQDQAKQ